VSSQPQERVRQALNIYTQKVWQTDHIKPITRAEAESIVTYYWCSELPDQPTPRRLDLPDHLIGRLCEACSHLPVILEEWIKGLRALWVLPRYFQLLYSLLD
jgi:hypothetical protein